MTTYLPQRFHVVHSAPVWMSYPERVIVYSLIAGLAPERILEIGTFKGGSTLIMCAALDDLDTNQESPADRRIVCVDPNPRVAPEDWEAVSHRATMVAAPSPEALTEAASVAGRGFDFALIDGDHTYDGVVRDIEATIPTLADEAHVIFHDAHYYEVRDGIDDEIKRHEGAFEDAGMLSTASTLEPNGNGGHDRWGGIRMLRYRRPGA